MYVRHPAQVSHTKVLNTPPEFLVTLSSLSPHLALVGLAQGCLYSHANDRLKVDWKQF